MPKALGVRGAGKKRSIVDKFASPNGGLAHQRHIEREAVGLDQQRETIELLRSIDNRLAWLCDAVHRQQQSGVDA